jgi:hypothetical protein
MWFDADKLMQLIDVASRDLQLPSEAQVTLLQCPKCDLPLSTFQYPQTHVDIDMCGKCCGLWLYPGEFQEIDTVRSSLKKKGEVEAYDPVTGIKGSLVEWINSAITTLLDYS